MISISRPACGAFSGKQLQRKTCSLPQFTEYKGVNIPILSSSMLFSKIIITILKNILIFAEKFDIIKPTGENNDFNV